MPLNRQGQLLVVDRGAFRMVPAEQALNLYRNELSRFQQLLTPFPPSRLPS